MKSSIFFRMVVSFLIVIIPIYLLSLFFTEWAASRMQAEIEKSMQVRAEFYTDSLEREVTRSVEMLREFLYDDDLLMLSVAGSVMTPNERTAAVSRFFKRLEILERSSSLNKLVSAYIPAMERTITSRMMLDHFDAGMYEELERIPDEGRIFYLNGNYYVKFSQPRSYFFQKEDPAAIMLLELSEEQIRSDLKRIMNMQGGGAMLIHPEDRWMIAAEDPPPFDWERIDSFMDEYENGGGRRIEAEQVMYSVARADTPFGSLLLYVPEQLALQPLRQYRLWLLALSLASLLLVLLFSYWLYKFLHQPLKRMIAAFRKVRRGHLDIDIKHESTDEFNHLYEQFNYMVERIQYLLNEVYEKEYLKQQAELKHLQSQINPHFLYNSFFILNRMIANEDLEQANTFSMHLGKYFQYITKLDREEVPLSAEIDFIRSYIDIQLVRFSNRIRVEMDPLPEAIRNLSVPKLSVQPVIENVFVHGFRKTVQGGLLRIRFRSEAGHAAVIVEDNGRGMNDAELEAVRAQFGQSADGTVGSGLFNVHRRLQLKQGPEAGLSLSRNEDGGLTVEIRFAGKGEQTDASVADR